MAGHEQNSSGRVRSPRKKFQQHSATKALRITTQESSFILPVPSHLLSRHPERPPQLEGAPSPTRKPRVQGAAGLSSLRGRHAKVLLWSHLMSVPYRTTLLKIYGTRELPADSDQAGLKWNLKVCVSNQPPWATLCKILGNLIQSLHFYMRTLRSRVGR